ncbi:hypothetical protein NRA32_05550 [Acinetobacter baumannii]|nr:hypothetical protein [Acinetobacter baumannii]
MNLEQYLHRQQVEKEATEAATRSVNEIARKVSMFKVGQDAVLNNSSQNKVMKIQSYNDEFIRAYWSKGEYSFAHESNFRHATPQEIAAGHRIDKPSNSRELETIDEPIGSLQELYPEFAKVLHENFLELLGDDFPIENHISPNCEVRDV